VYGLKSGYGSKTPNSFYCSAEQVFRPQWRGKPIIVLSNNDGCIVAANKQAIALGIQKFQPFFKVRELCEQKGIIACSSNYELYADLSHKMMQVMDGLALHSIFTPLMNLS
jgi:DNA polymerase V